MSIKRVYLCLFFFAKAFLLPLALTAATPEWGMIQVWIDVFECTYKFARMDLPLDKLEYMMKDDVGESWFWAPKGVDSDASIEWVPWPQDQKERTFKKFATSSGGIDPRTHFTREKLEKFYDNLQNKGSIADQDAYLFPPPEIRYTLQQRIWTLPEPNVIDELGNYYSLAAFKNNGPSIKKALAPKKLQLLQQQAEAQKLILPKREVLPKKRDIQTTSQTHSSQQSIPKTPDDTELPQAKTEKLILPKREVLSKKRDIQTTSQTHGSQQSIPKTPDDTELRQPPIQAETSSYIKRTGLIGVPTLCLLYACKPKKSNTSKVRTKRKKKKKGLKQHNKKRK